MNDTYAGGVPDFFIEGSARDLWLEVKYIKNFPKRESTIIDLSNHKKYLSMNQQLWLERRSLKRNDAAVLVGSEHGGVLLTDMQWTAPFSSLEIKERSLSMDLVVKKVKELISAQI